jgi:hypothetical protein
LRIVAVHEFLQYRTQAGPFSADRKDRGSSKSTSRRDEAVKGVSQEILSQRKKDGVCLRCGRSGHGWSECWAKEPNTKEKRKEPSSESGSSASKRPKTSAAAAAQAARWQLVGPDQDPRLFWTAMGEFNPHLARIATRLLQTPCNSVPSERSLSAQNLIHRSGGTGSVTLELLSLLTWSARKSLAGCLPDDNVE